MADEVNVNEVAKTRKPRAKRTTPSASQEAFCLIVNASENRKDAIAQLANAGTPMKDSAFIARYTSYIKRGVTLKEFPPAPRGKKLDVAALNAAIAASATPKVPA